MSKDVRRGFRESLEDFISIYRSQHCLWQIKSKDYHNKDKRNDAYNKLINKLKEIDPSADRDKVTRKINSIRTNYRKEKKKIEESLLPGSGADVYVPSLWYYNHLTFLSDQENSCRAMEEDYEIPGVEIETPVVKSELENTVDENSSSAITCDPTSQYSREKALKRSFDSNVADDVPLSVQNRFEGPPIQDDRYDLFGKYVAMKMRDLPKTQRLYAEKIINDTLFQAELGNLTITQAN